MVSWKYNLHSVAWNPFPIDHLPILFLFFQPNSNGHNDFSNYCCSRSSVVKEFAFKCRKRRFNSWVRKIPWRRKWQPTPVFLPGKFHGQRSLAGYSPWGHKESDMTEHTGLLHLYCEYTCIHECVHVYGNGWVCISNIKDTHTHIYVHVDSYNASLMIM